MNNFVTLPRPFFCNLDHLPYASAGLRSDKSGRTVADCSVNSLSLSVGQ